MGSISPGCRPEGRKRSHRGAEVIRLVGQVRSGRSTGVYARLAPVRHRAGLLHRQRLHLGVVIFALTSGLRARRCNTRLSVSKSWGGNWSLSSSLADSGGRARANSAARMPPPGRPRCGTKEELRVRAQDSGLDHVVTVAHPAADAKARRGDGKTPGVNRCSSAPWWNAIRTRRAR